MKTRAMHLFSTIFGVSMLYAVFSGALVAVLYILGFILGGPVGESLALFGARMMKSGIPIAALGSSIGMLGFYIEGVHELTMGKKQEPATE